MSSPLPDVPKIGWFEMEILYYLMERKRYGNEMRLLLNEHLGEDRVTTGKLYPVLKKLERWGLIKRLKVKESDIEKMETGMRNILTRGVERIYFEITDEGMDAVDKAIHFSSFFHFNNLMRSLHERVRDKITWILEPLENEISMGVLSTPTKPEINRAIEMLPHMEEGELIFLLLGSKKDLNMDLSSEFDVDVTSFPCKFDDIPLKSNYFDVVISITHLHDVPDTAKLIKEMVRTIKPGGQFILVDLANFNSLILEDIMKHNIDIARAPDYEGEDIDALAEILDDLVVKVHVERVKELFILHGKKRKRMKRAPSL